jgi:D-alanine-D-alanine ligase
MIRKILVLTGDHGAPDPTKREGRYHAEDLATHAAMAEAFLAMAGFDVEVVSRHAGLLDRLRSDPPDLVVNFCDTGFFNVPTQELHVAAYLELFGIPYTGAPPAAMVLCYDKQAVRLIAEAMGVTVPWERLVPGDAPREPPGDLAYPALIKPNRADGSVGITKDAVVHSADAARTYLAFLGELLPGGDALIQEYLPGPEYGLGLIGNPDTGLTALPPLEVDFSRLPAGLAPILSFESKALPDSPYWTEIKFRQADLSAAEAGAMADAARRLFRRFGLRDYARFDFRRGADGLIKLMEVNPNPAWANDGKLAFMAGFAGIAYPAMLRMILDAAVARLGGATEAD